jgi:hypothetical protein
MQKPWTSGSLKLYMTLFVVALGFTIYPLHIMWIDPSIPNLWIVPAVSSILCFLFFGASLKEYYNEKTVNVILEGMGYVDDLSYSHIITDDNVYRLRGINVNNALYFIDTDDLDDENYDATEIELSSKLSLFFCSNHRQLDQKSIYIVRDRRRPLTMGGLCAYGKPFIVNLNDVVIGEVNE